MRFVVSLLLLAGGAHALSATSQHKLSASSAAEPTVEAQASDCDGMEWSEAITQPCFAEWVMTNKDAVKKLIELVNTTDVVSIAAAWNRLVTHALMVSQSKKRFISAEDIGLILPPAPASYPDNLQGVSWLDQSGFYGHSTVPSLTVMPDLCNTFGDSSFGVLDPKKRTIDVSPFGEAWQWSNTLKARMLFSAKLLYYTFAFNEDYTVGQVIPKIAGLPKVKLSSLSSLAEDPSAAVWNTLKSNFEHPTNVDLNFLLNWTMVKQTPAEGECPPKPSATKLEVNKCASWIRNSIVKHPNASRIPFLGNKFGRAIDKMLTKVFVYPIFEIIDKFGQKKQPYFDKYVEWAKQQAGRAAADSFTGKWATDLPKASLLAVSNMLEPDALEAVKDYFGRITKRFGVSSLSSIKLLSNGMGGSSKNAPLQQALQEGLNSAVQGGFGFENDMDGSVSGGVLLPEKNEGDFTSDPYQEDVLQTLFNVGKDEFSENLKKGLLGKFPNPDPPLQTLLGTAPSPGWALMHASALKFNTSAFGLIGKPKAPYAIISVDIPSPAHTLYFHSRQASVLADDFRMLLFVPLTAEQITISVYTELGGDLLGTANMTTPDGGWSSAPGSVTFSATTVEGSVEMGTMSVALITTNVNETWAKLKATYNVQLTNAFDPVGDPNDVVPGSGTCRLTKSLFHGIAELALNPSISDALSVLMNGKVTGVCGGGATLKRLAAQLAFVADGVQSLAALGLGTIGAMGNRFASFYAFMYNRSYNDGRFAPGLGPGSTNVLSHAEVVTSLKSFGAKLQDHSHFRGDNIGLIRLNGFFWDTHSIGLGNDELDHAMYRPLLVKLLGPKVAAGVKGYIAQAAETYFEQNIVSFAEDPSLWTCQVLHKVILGLEMTTDDCKAFVGKITQVLANSIGGLSDQVLPLPLPFLTESLLSWKKERVQIYTPYLEKKLEGDTMWTVLNDYQKKIVMESVLDALMFAGGLSVPASIHNAFAVLYSEFGQEQLGRDFVLTEEKIEPLVWETIRRFPAVIGFPSTDRISNSNVAINLLSASFDKKAWGGDALGFQLRPMSTYHQKSVSWADAAVVDNDLAHGYSHACPGKVMSTTMVYAFLKAYLKAGGQACWVSDTQPSKIEFKLVGLTTKIKLRNKCGCYSNTCLSNTLVPATTSGPLAVPMLTPELFDGTIHESVAASKNSPNTSMNDMTTANSMSVAAKGLGQLNSVTQALSELGSNAQLLGLQTEFGFEDDVRSLMNGGAVMSKINEAINSLSGIARNSTPLVGMSLGYGNISLSKMVAMAAGAATDLAVPSQVDGRFGEYFTLLNTILQVLYAKWSIPKVAADCSEGEQCVGMPLPQHQLNLLVCPGTNVTFPITSEAQGDVEFLSASAVTEMTWKINKLAPMATSVDDYGFWYQGENATDVLRKALVSNPDDRILYNWAKDAAPYSDEALTKLFFNDLGQHRVQYVNHTADPHAPPDARFGVYLDFASTLPIMEGFGRPGGDLYMDDNGAPIGIRYGGKMYTPKGSAGIAKSCSHLLNISAIESGPANGSAWETKCTGATAGWDYAKFVLRATFNIVLTAIDHLHGLHMVVANAIAQSNQVNLPSSHPLRRMMTPFAFRTNAINYLAATLLVPPKGLLARGLPLKWEGMEALFSFSHATYGVKDNMFTNPSAFTLNSEVTDEAVPKLKGKELPLWEDGRDYYKIIRTFAEGYLKNHYEFGKTPDACHADRDVRSWYAHVDSMMPNADMPELTCESLLDVTARIMTLVSAGHRHVGNNAGMTADPCFAPYSWTEGELCGSPRAAAIGALVIKSTGLSQPKIISPYPGYAYLFNDQADKELWFQLNTSLIALNATVTERNKGRVIPYEVFRTDLIETAVSI